MILYISHVRAKSNLPTSNGKSSNSSGKKEPVQEESRKKIHNDYDRIRNLIKDEPRKIKQ